jgi:hypothetical protein
MLVEMTGFGMLLRLSVQVCPSQLCWGVGLKGHSLRAHTARCSRCMPAHICWPSPGWFRPLHAQVGAPAIVHGGVLYTAIASGCLALCIPVVRGGPVGRGDAVLCCAVLCIVHEDACMVQHLVLCWSSSSAALDVPSCKV